MFLSKVNQISYSLKGPIKQLTSIDHSILESVADDADDAFLLQVLTWKSILSTKEGESTVKEVVHWDVI